MKFKSFCNKFCVKRDGPFSIYFDKSELGKIRLARNEVFISVRTSVLDFNRPSLMDHVFRENTFHFLGPKIRF